jgi:GT2 family glycosyltransferase
MYKNWEQYIGNRYARFGDNIKEGVSGSCVVVRRKAFDKLGLWDENIESGDFDFLIRTKARSLEFGDIRPLHILLGVYFHHYSRLTRKSKSFAPYVDLPIVMRIKEKWGEERMKKILEGVEY